MKETGIASLERLPTGVPGLDVVLKGGLFSAGVYLILGPPGAGKTILSNQIAFNHAHAGGRALYVTLLAESHARMLAHLQHFSFFDPDVVARSLTYISGYQSLEAEKLKGLLQLIRDSAREFGATMLVIDGMVSARSAAETELLFKKFVHELKVLGEMEQFTTLMLASLPAEAAQYPAQTMVDGILVLRHGRSGMRRAREIDVVKLRGGDVLEGGHFFEITTEGLRVHPRLEAVYEASPAVAEESTAKARIGCERLDEMLGGGLNRGGTTVVLGSPGAGKTLLALQFLAEGAAEGEAGLYVGFYEGPPRLLGKAASVGIALEEPVREGTVRILWQPALELIADKVAEEILGGVREAGAKRLVIDGLEAFSSALFYPERAGRVLSALSHQLRALGVTTLLTHNTPLGMTDLVVPPESITTVAENIVVLRYLEADGRIKRLICILKMREGAYDSSIHEFRVTSEGFEIETGPSSRAAPRKRKAGGGARTRKKPARAGARRPRARR